MRCWIDEIEKQDINSDISEPSIEEPTSDRTDFSATDHYEKDSSSVQWMNHNCLKT